MRQYGQTAAVTVDQDGVAQFAKGGEGIKIQVNMRQTRSGDWRSKQVSMWLKQKISEHPGVVFNRNPTCAKGTIELSNFTSAIDKPVGADLEPKTTQTSNILLPGTRPVFNFVITGTEGKAGHEE